MHTILIALVLSLFLGIGAFEPAAANGNPAGTQSAAQNGQGKIQVELASQMASQNAADSRIRVIVSLQQSQPAGISRAAAIADAQNRALEAFRGSNNGRGLGVLSRYQTLFGFSADLTSGQINALAQRADVTSIELMPVHYKSYNESFPLTDVDLAHNSGALGTGSVIAIIDDGIDAAHPAFAGKLLGGYDFADFDNDPTNDCAGQSHGTAVAGVALGNGGGAIGVAPEAKMVFLKIQSASYCGQNALDGDVIGAIDWAVANKNTYGIDVISMSLGGGSYSSTSSCDNSSSAYFSAITNATNAGILVVAASGNEGRCDSMSRPACFSSVVSVGAVYDASNLGNLGWCVDRKTCADASPHQGCPRGSRAVFEDAIADNVIAYSNSASFLDVVAPATCATSAAPGNSTTSCFGGTSSATPFTSGVAALAVESAGKGALTPAGLRSLLTDTGDLVNDPKNGRVSPRVNGSSAVDNAPFYVGEPPPPPNSSPNASFDYTCSLLTCNFDGSGSSDSDGTVMSYEWTFGDGAQSSGSTTDHTYAAAGSYTVTLTVTDDDGAEGIDSQSVTVSSGGGGITLAAAGYKVKGRQRADLTWSGASSSDVDVFRDGSLIVTTPNDGEYTDIIGARGGGSYDYQICEAQTSACSSVQSVNF